MNNDVEITVAIMLTSHSYLLSISSCIATACAINGVFFSYAAPPVTLQPMLSWLFEPTATVLVIADRGSGRLNNEPDKNKHYQLHPQTDQNRHFTTG